VQQHDVAAVEVLGELARDTDLCIGVLFPRAVLCGSPISRASRAE